MRWHTWLMSIVGVALGAAGCSADDDSPPGAVTGPVELSAFCAAYNTAYCEAVATCCTTADPLYPSVEACVAADPCPVIASDPRFDSGEWVYDAAAAGDFLRALPTAADRCEATRPSLDFLYPGVSAGEALGDPCDVEADTCADGHCEGGACVERAEAGAPCVDDGACVSGRCVHPSSDEAVSCADGGCSCDSLLSDLYCEAEMTPPENGSVDWSEIDYIKLCARSGAHAGTNSAVTMTYYHDDVSYTCTQAAGLGSGQCMICSVTFHLETITLTEGVGSPQDDYGRYDFSSGSLSNKPWIEVAMGGTDGLKIGSLTFVTTEETGVIHTQFNNDDPNKLRCTGCNLSDSGCDGCYLDADNNGQCVRAVVNMKSDNGKIRCLEGD